VIVSLRFALAALLGIAAIFVVARRLAGALETPLGPRDLFLSGLVLAGLAFVAHPPARARRFHLGNVLISPAVLAVAAALSLPGSNALALFAFWVVILGEELLAFRRTRLRRSAAGVPFDVNPRAEQDELEPKEPDADVLQQFTLRATAAGGQELSGWLRVSLRAGQRTGSSHLAFCPAFNRMPTVLAEPVSGPACQIKAAQILPYGARLDLKLDEPTKEDASILVWVFAVNGSA